MENRILKAAQIKEAATKGDINALYMDIYNFMDVFNASEMKLMGQAIGLQTAKAFGEAFNLASKEQKEAFRKAMIDQLKKIK
jgi:hypothetical protein